LPANWRTFFQAVLKRKALTGYANELRRGRLMPGGAGIQSVRNHPFPSVSAILTRRPQRQQNAAALMRRADRPITMAVVFVFSEKSKGGISPHEHYDRTV
jgi:hypothetical protein